MRRPRPLAQRLIIYITVLTIGPLLLAASLALTSYVFTLTGLGRRPPMLMRIALDWMPAFASLFAFAALYRFVPNRRVSWRDAFIGAVAATIGFELAKRAFAIYVSNIAVYTTLYGALAVLPMFLLWIYVSWLITLGGAVMAAGGPAWRHKYWKRPDVPGTPFVEALLMLRALCVANAESMRDSVGGVGLTVDQLSRAASIDVNEAEVMLEHLETGGVVRCLGPAFRSGWLFARRGRPQRWALAGDPAAIRIGELFRHLVYDARRIALVTLDADDPLAARLRQMHLADQDLSLQEFFDDAGHA